MGRYILALGLLVPAVAGCERSARDAYARTVANALASEPNVRSFHSLFPKSEHFISYFSGAAGQPCWNSIAGLHGRYVLTMQFDVMINRKKATLIASGEPEFRLVEVESITALPGGRAEVRYGPTQKVFGPREWAKLVESGGDLSSLGIEVKKEKPVAGFEEHWRQS
jgi:hypothetical protein